MPVIAAFGDSREKSVLLGQRYRDVAEREGVAFLDAGQFIRCSDLDGIHYEADQHELLGRPAAKAVREVLDATPQAARPFAIARRSSRS